jgi:hypothetical protein
MMLTAIAKQFLSDLDADEQTQKAKVRLSGLSPTRSFGCSSRRRMRESYRLSRENGANFHFAPKRLNVLAECTQMPIRASLESRYGCLRHLQLPCQVGLRHFQRGTELADFDFGQVAVGHLAGPALLRLSSV